jgi:hypothetical protein
VTPSRRRGTGKLHRVTVALVVAADARGQRSANGPEERRHGLGRGLRQFIQRPNGGPPRIIPNCPWNTRQSASVDPKPTAEDNRCSLTPFKPEVRAKARRSRVYKDDRRARPVGLLRVPSAYFWAMVGSWT